MEEFIYPVTILMDRYSGVYSGAAWTAFNLDPEDVPTGASGCDTVCADFWEDTDLIVGKGLTPDDALKDLKDQLTKES